MQIQEPQARLSAARCVVRIASDNEASEELVTHNVIPVLLQILQTTYVRLYL